MRQIGADQFWKHLRRGIGVAFLMQGSGIPLIDMGAAAMKMNEDGSVNLYVGATDIGTGSDTILSQIAAEKAGIFFSCINPMAACRSVGCRL